MLKMLITTVVVAGIAAGAYFYLDANIVDEDVDIARPGACDALRSAGVTTAMGEGSLSTIGSEDEGDITVSICRYEPKDPTNDGLTLLLRMEPADAPAKDVEALRDADMAQLRDILDDDVFARPLDIGDAAIWIEDMNLMTVWMSEGRVVAQITGIGGSGSQQRFTQLAEGLVAQFP